MQNHSYGNEFPLHVLFHANQERFCTRTCFETEAQGNSGMVYYSQLLWAFCVRLKRLGVKEVTAVAGLYNPDPVSEFLYISSLFFFFLRTKFTSIGC